MAREGHGVATEVDERISPFQTRFPNSHSDVFKDGREFPPWGTVFFACSLEEEIGIWAVALGQ